ncbi:TetR/AcrR family transcriptional regulator [Nonomuraea typhae]|uniref:TetR/AcrR family transcriptional regulator n=1 Tax=Nonomuraea typhae TaxID=2603600 RepID=UPI0012F9AB88|nr:TetR/AcrR family transcriptional regulator [Nonomuraea typhae]
MGRPQKISDAELIAACERAIAQWGQSFTLAHVALEAGVAASTVVTRFGSKRALLLRMMDLDSAALRQRMRAAADAQPDPVAAVLAAAIVVAQGVDDPETTANHLSQLAYDISDPTLRSGLAHMRDAYRAELQALLETAALPGAPKPALAARVLAALVHGVQIDWALAPEGHLMPSLKSQLAAVLDGWRRRPGRG